MAWVPAVMGAAASMWGQENANTANAAQNQLQMDWQERMSDTAVQRRMADMARSGINPILAAGNPASQPGSSMTPMQSITGGIGQGVQAGIAAAAQVENVRADTRQKLASAKQTEWNTGDQGVPIDANGEPQWDKAGGGMMGNYNAAQAYQGIKNLKATYDNIIQATKTGSAQQSLTETQKMIQELTLTQQQQLYDTVLKKAAADLSIAQANAKDAESMAKITGNPTWGPIIKLFRAIFPGGARL